MHERASNVTLYVLCPSFIYTYILLKEKLNEEVTGRRRRTRKKPLDDLNEKNRIMEIERGSMRGEALDRTLCRTRFVRGYGPVVRQTTE